MNPTQAKLLTDAWVTATWEDYIRAIEDPVYETARSFYHNGRMRIEMTPLGHDHAHDNTIISFTVNLFCSIKGIPAKGLTNCSYRKVGCREAQPDASYYIGETADVIPWGTAIVSLDDYPPPSLVIEVANASLSDDKGEKRLLYEDLGVNEYWIIDVQNVQIIAFSIAGGGSKRIQQSQVLSGLSIALLQDALHRSRQTNQSQVCAWLLTQFQT